MADKKNPLFTRHLMSVFFGLKMKVALREAKVPFLVFYVAFLILFPQGCVALSHFSFTLLSQRRQLYSGNCIWQVPIKPISIIWLNVILPCMLLFFNCSFSSHNDEKLRFDWMRFLFRRENLSEDEYIFSYFSHSIFRRH